MSAARSRIIRQLTSDKRKLSLVICLLAVGMLLWGRLLLKQLPKSAVAEPERSAADKADPAGTDARSNPVHRRQTVFVDLSTQLQRDLFELSPKYFPIEVEESKQPVKSTQTDADNPNALAAAIRQKAMQLRLQTTILGNDPKALIDGQLLKPGDRIKGFRVLDVTRRTVILEMNGIEIELEM